MSRTRVRKLQDRTEELLSLLVAEATLVAMPRSTLSAVSVTKTMAFRISTSECTDTTVDDESLSVGI
jgi:hypothetical protein